MPSPASLPIRIIFSQRRSPFSDQHGEALSPEQDKMPEQDKIVEDFLKRLNITKSDFETYLFFSLDSIKTGSSSGTSPSSVICSISSPLVLPRLSSQEKAYIQQIANSLLDNTNPFLKFIDPENKLRNIYKYEDFKEKITKDEYVLNFTYKNHDDNLDIDRLIFELNRLKWVFLFIYSLSFDVTLRLIMNGGSSNLVNAPNS